MHNIKGKIKINNNTWILKIDQVNALQEWLGMLFLKENKGTKIFQRGEIS